MEMGLYPFLDFSALTGCLHQFQLFINASYLLCLLWFDLTVLVDQLLFNMFMYSCGLESVTWRLSAMKVLIRFDYIRSGVIPMNVHEN